MVLNVGFDVVEHFGSMFELFFHGFDELLMFFN